jgi:hypothetical protein
LLNKIEEDSDLKCECYIQYKIELTKVISELKSAMKIIEILKEGRGIDDSSMDIAAANIYNHEEEIYSSSRYENWTHVATHLHKRDPSGPNKSPSTIIRTANRFEVLHNLDKEPANKTNKTKKKSHKPSVITQE